MNSEEKYCLWADIQSGADPQMDLFSKMAERIPYGGYVFCMVDTKVKIERLLKKLKKKPCLIEKYIKINQQ